jgi:4'-phosphopantetheinyl transferase
MPLFKELKDHNSSIFIWEVTESESDLSADLDDLISLRINKNNKLEKRRIEKYVQACLLLKAKIDPLSVYYSHTGKPIIESNNQHISFSHSGKYAALIVSNKSCGIDIEEENPKIEKISPKFLNEIETRFLTIPGALTWIWCIKEAVFKSFGERVTFKDDIIIDRFDLDLLIAHVSYKGVHGSGKFEIKLDRIENYYLAYTKEFQHK